jgi:hypothetical protein
MKTITRRIRRLELGAGVIETAESRRDRELAEELLHRRAAWRLREGIPEPTEESEEDLRGMTLAAILIQGRQRARARNLASREDPA